MKIRRVLLVLAIAITAGIFTISQSVYALSKIQKEAQNVKKAKDRIEMRDMETRLKDTPHSGLIGTDDAVALLVLYGKTNADEVERREQIKIAFKKIAAGDNSVFSDMFGTKGATTAEKVPASKIGYITTEKAVALQKAADGTGTVFYNDTVLDPTVLNALIAVAGKGWIRSLGMTVGKGEEPHRLTSVSLDVVAFNGAAVVAGDKSLIDRINKVGPGEIPVIIARSQSEYDRLMDRSEKTGIVGIRRDVYVTLIENASVWDAIFQGQDFRRLNDVNTDDLLNVNVLRDLATAK